MFVSRMQNNDGLLKVHQDSTQTMTDALRARGLLQLEYCGLVARAYGLSHEQCHG